MYRIDKTGDGNNNQKMVKLFGHPALLKLPNQISGGDLYNIVALLHPYEEPFKLHLVDGQVYKKRKYFNGGISIYISFIIFDFRDGIVQDVCLINIVEDARYHKIVIFR